MKCTLVVFFLVSVFAAVIFGELCNLKDDCTLESCGDHGEVACDHGYCTCQSTMTGCTGRKDCDQHGGCHEHGHGHHSSWHCLDGECRCI